MEEDGEIEEDGEEDGDEEGEIERDGELEIEEDGETEEDGEEEGEEEGELPEKIKATSASDSALLNTATSSNFASDGRLAVEPSLFCAPIENLLWRFPSFDPAVTRVPLFTLSIYPYTLVPSSTNTM